MRCLARPLIAAWVVCAGAAMGSAQAPSLRISSPAPGELATGPMVLRADVAGRDGAAAVESLTFYVDGVIVCAKVAPVEGRCNWNAGALVRERLVRVVGTLRGGGRVVATVRTGKLDHAENVRVDVVHVGAIVTDSNGDLVPGLARDAFRLFDGNAAQSITHFSAAGVALDLLVAVDVSGSMADALPDLKEAVRAFLGAVRADDRVSLIAFNDGIFTLAERESDRARRLQAVDKLSAWGGTALYDVLGRAIDAMSEGTGRRAIVVFTDGADRASVLGVDAVQRKLEASDAMLFMVALGHGTTDRSLRATLDALAGSTGGRVLYAERPRELGDRFSTILHELAHQYVLGFEPRDRKRDGAWRPLRVEMVDRRYRVRARRGYRDVAE
jgi:VWFA-related protein